MSFGSPDKAVILPRIFGEPLSLGSGGGGGGGGASQLKVFDNNTLIESNATGFNFIGTNVLAVAGPGANEVTVYTPSNATPYASLFGTDNTGNTDATIQDLTSGYSFRFPAKPNASKVYTIVPFPLNSQVPTIRDSIIQYKTVQKFRISSLTTQLRATLAAGNQVSTFVSYTTPAITGNGTFTSGGVTIQVTNFGSNAGFYEADVLFTFNLVTIMAGSPSSLAVFLEHVGQTGAVGYVLYFFYDPDTLNFTSTVPTYAFTGGSPIRHVSGVAYYSNGSQVTVSASTNNINAFSYPPTSVIIESPDLGVFPIVLGANNLTGWTEDWDSAPIINRTLSPTTEIAIVGTPTITVTGFDWDQRFSYVATGTPILLNTSSSVADNNTEYFQEESRRLNPSAPYGLWNPTALLSPTDAQVINGVLTRQGGDYTGYAPTNTASYAVNALNQVYVRSFENSLSQSNSNGILTLGGLDETDLSTGRVLIDISKDGVIWYSLNSDYFGGSLTSGAGCRINSDTIFAPSLNFTLGTGGFTSASTGSSLFGNYGIFLRITLKPAFTGAIGQMSINWP